MNSMQKTSPFFALSLMVLVGCTHFHQTLIGEEKTFPATKSQSIEVFLSNEAPVRDYEEVGYIVAQKGSEEAAIAFLKDRAAKMGADALLKCEVRVHRRLLIIILFIPIFEDTYIASGVAIKYTDLSLKGG
jgi:uncharacterized protein YbjQ (UPF0145 family)